MGEFDGQNAHSTLNLIVGPTLGQLGVYEITFWSENINVVPTLVLC